MPSLNMRSDVEPLGSWCNAFQNTFQYAFLAYVNPPPLIMHSEVEPLGSWCNAPTLFSNTPF